VKKNISNLHFTKKNIYSVIMNFLRETILLIMDVQMESDTVGGNNTESCLVKYVINFALQVLI